MFWWRRTINLWFVPCGVSWVLSWEKAFLRWSLVLWKLRKWSQAGWLKLKRLLEVTLFALNPSWYFFGKYSLYDYILFVRNMLFLSFNSNRVEKKMKLPQPIFYAMDFLGFRYNCQHWKCLWWLRVQSFFFTKG